MKPDEYLDWVLDYYRAEQPGVTDAAIYELMLAELGPHSAVALLMAQRIGAEIELQPPTLAKADPRDPFFQSFEWRRLRMQVLETRGARCECCGRSAADGIVINVDHIKPRKRYPQLALSETNLQVLCNECNHGKGNLFETDWRPETRA